jgi:hypothetical protein
MTEEGRSREMKKAKQNAEINLRIKAIKAKGTLGPIFFAIHKEGSIYVAIATAEFTPNR